MRSPETRTRDFTVRTSYCLYCLCLAYIDLNDEFVPDLFIYASLPPTRFLTPNTQYIFEKTISVSLTGCSGLDSLR